MVIALVVAVLALIGVAAPATAAERPPLVDQILELCGLREKIEHLPGVVYSQLHDQPAPPDLTSREAVTRAIQEAFEARRLYGTVADGVARRFDPGRGEALAATLQTDLMRRMARLEVEASRPEALGNMIAFAARMMISERPAPARMALVRRLDAAIGATALSLAVDVASRQGVTRVVDVVLPTTQRRNPPATFDRSLSGLSPDVSASARAAIEVALLFTYRSVPDDDLARYVEFTESEPGQWLNRLAREGIVDALEAASSEAVELTRNTVAGRQRL